MSVQNTETLRLSESEFMLFETKYMINSLRNEQIMLKNDVKEKLRDYEQFHSDISKAILIAIQQNKLKRLKHLKQTQSQIVDKMANFKKVLTERDNLKKTNLRLANHMKKRDNIRLKADERISALRQTIYKDLNNCIDDCIKETKDISDNLNLILSSASTKNANKDTEKLKDLQRKINILKLVIVEYQERQFHVKTQPFTILDSLIDKMQYLDDLEQVYKFHKSTSLP